LITVAVTTINMIFICSITWNVLNLSHVHYRAHRLVPRVSSIHQNQTRAFTPWPLGRCCHRRVWWPRRGSSKGVTTLFACGLINRGGGRPCPLSWHFPHLHTPFGS
jgi:hypothetical protein